MPLPICVECRVEMRCEKNDRLVNDPPAAGFPSTYWAGDEFTCPTCGVAVVTGFGESWVPASVPPDSLEFTYKPVGDPKAQKAQDDIILAQLGLELETTQALARLGVYTLREMQDDIDSVWLGLTPRQWLDLFNAMVRHGR